MKKLLLFTTLIAIVAFSSCKNNTIASATPFSVKITDAPGAYDALMLSIKEINVITSEGQTTLPVDSKPFDILKFRMGKDTLLAGQDIPSGRLQEIRLVLNDTGNEVVVGGQPFNLTTPGGQSSGVKIKVQDDLTDGLAYTLLLDFDAAKSIVKKGNGNYLLKPVIRAIPQAVSGAISGIVSPSGANAKLFAITGTDTIGALADTTGKFFFTGLAAGTYKVNVELASPYQPTSIENVQVETGSVKDLGTITVSQ